MIRISNRILTLVLVSCLVANPATSVVLSNTLSPTWERVAESRVRGQIFFEQALADPAVHVVTSMTEAKASLMHEESQRQPRAVESSGLTKTELARKQSLQMAIAAQESLQPFQNEPRKGLYLGGVGLQNI